MASAVLALNAGSSSIKFAVYRFDNSEKPALICKGAGERHSSGAQLVIKDANGKTLGDQTSPSAEHFDPILSLLERLQPILTGAELVAVGHRIVHGGSRFAEPVLIDNDVLASLDELTPLAPLHQPACLAPVRTLLDKRPDLAQVGCFDTAFHRELEPINTRFPIPDMGEEVHRYGFHGLSFEYIRQKLAAPKRATVIAHLGSGCSVCAISDGRCINTSMSMTPLDGLLMATRCGAIDPGLLLYLQKSKGLSVQELEDLLYYKSGLLGLSGHSGDMRALLAAQDPESRIAVEQFCARAAEHVAVMATSLGGLDQLVFTGGIGENSPDVRRKICQRLRFFGVDIDDAANIQGIGNVSAIASRVEVRVIPTNEEEVVAGHTARLVPRH